MLKAGLPAGDFHQSGRGFTAEWNLVLVAGIKFDIVFYGVGNIYQPKIIIDINETKKRLAGDKT